MSVSSDMPWGKNLVVSKCFFTPARRPYCMVKEIF